MNAFQPAVTGAGEPPLTLKIVVAGGCGAGKTTLVGTVSETRPLRTEAPASGPRTRPAGTTVAMDYGRITLKNGLALCLFGAPAQDRFSFLGDDLARGALGAVVLADPRRLPDCLPTVDHFEDREIPHVVAVNCFDGVRGHHGEDAAEALGLGSRTPVLLCDVRDRAAVKGVLVSLVEHAGRRHAARLRTAVG
ncbi:signal recognition particle receptor subunit beta [Streptomyces sp. DSM 41037]|uniref:GTP-binding protein n=1 Tax=Streptomyces sp. DSM 41037 TaxID=2817710 RepID=UPI0027852EEA|nr:ATP/GTP-binding protein [Streptomyces sp. DSM 41037]MDQ0292354.1 signal recognition particle receptor subunit beta [Streptomyces sp. DSM 41037]